MRIRDDHPLAIVETKSLPRRHSWPLLRSCVQDPCCNRSAEPSFAHLHQPLFNDGIYVCAIEFNDGMNVPDISMMVCMYVLSKLHVVINQLDQALLISVNLCCDDVVMMMVCIIFQRSVGVVSENVCAIFQ